VLRQLRCLALIYFGQLKCFHYRFLKFSYNRGSHYTVERHKFVALFISIHIRLIRPEHIIEIVELLNAFFRQLSNDRTNKGIHDLPIVSRTVPLLPTRLVLRGKARWFVSKRTNILDNLLRYIHSSYKDLDSES
jgi:hypothetical protein